MPSLDFKKTLNRERSIVPKQMPELSPEKVKMNIKINKFEEQLGRDKETGFMHMYRDTSTNIDYNPNSSQVKPRVVHGKIG